MDGAPIYKLSIHFIHYIYWDILFIFSTQIKLLCFTRIVCIVCFVFVEGPLLFILFSYFFITSFWDFLVVEMAIFCSVIFVSKNFVKWLLMHLHLNWISKLELNRTEVVFIIRQM